ncbi:hypothetical protein ACTA71_006964, partial [Dictyostelium dimigraforme]
MPVLFLPSTATSCFNFYIYSFSNHKPISVTPTIGQSHSAASTIVVHLFRSVIISGLSLYLVCHCIWSVIVSGLSLYLVCHCIWSTLSYDPSLHLILSHLVRHCICSILSSTIYQSYSAASPGLSATCPFTTHAASSSHSLLMLHHQIYPLLVCGPLDLSRPMLHRRVHPPLMPHHKAQSLFMLLFHQLFVNPTLIMSIHYLSTSHEVSLTTVPSASRSISSTGPPTTHAVSTTAHELPAVKNKGNPSTGPYVEDLL